MAEDSEVTENGETEAERPARIPRRRDDYATFRIRRPQFISFAVMLAFVIGLSFGYVLWGGRTATNASQAAQVSQDSRRYDVPILESDPTSGPEDAPITIIEFSDFECPFCRSHFLEVLPRLKAAYPNQILYVFKDYPLSNIHPNAIPAAEAAHCAREQGAFWEFHDLLFGMRLELGLEAYLEYAQDLDLDMEVFSLCVEERRYADLVTDNYDFATQFGIYSTPTFFINGIAVIGAQAFEAFARVIDAELDDLQ